MFLARDGQRSPIGVVGFVEHADDKSACTEEGDIASVRLLEKLGFVRWHKRPGVVEYVWQGLE